MRQAIACYREIYDEDPHKHLWHGVNLVAWMHRARTDGVAIRGLPDSRVLAGAIVEAVRNPQGRAVESWDYASAAEACIALDDWDGATHWLERYIQEESTDRFALAGTLRQLTEVWRFTAETPEAGQLVVALRGALLKSRDGRLQLTPTQLQRTAPALDNPGPRLERILQPMAAGFAARSDLAGTSGAGIARSFREADLHVHREGR